MITTNAIRIASIARDQSGHGDPGCLSDLSHVWIEPGHEYGIGHDGVTIYGLRDLDDAGDDVYMISLLDMGDVEALRDEAQQAGDLGQYEMCADALGGDDDALLRCVECILDAQIEALADR